MAIPSDRKIFRLLIASVGCSLASLLGLLFMTVLYDDLNNELQQTLYDDLTLTSESSPSYQPWIDSSNADSAAVYSTYYVYNILNPDAILNGAKPLLEEIGPLVYLYNNMKYNVSWDDDTFGDTLTYKQYQYYTPVDNATITLGDTMITMLNIPLLSVLTNEIVALVVATTAGLEPYKTNSSLFIRRKASEALWGWQNDTFLFDLNRFKPAIIPFDFPTTFSGVQNNDSSLEWALATHSPNQMYTGKHTPDNLMQLAGWDGYNTMMCCTFGPCGDANGGAAIAPGIMPWQTDDANVIAGTSGSQFKIGIASTDVLRVETYDFGIYRHWDLTSDGTTYEIEDIDVIKFELPALTFDNSSQSADAEAYNAYGPNGLLNQSNCDSGAPIFLSKPRFLDGDPSLSAALQNFPAPVRSEHDTWLGVEPITGSALDFHWRIGVNILVAPTTASWFGDSFTFFENVAPVFLPVAWGGQDSGISDSQASQFKSQLLVNVQIITGIRYGGMALAIAGGVCAIGLAVGACCLRRRRNLLTKFADHNREQLSFTENSLEAPLVGARSLSLQEEPAF